MSARTILHVDLDAFFAAVEQRDRPELRGRPVVVGGAGGEDARGVVSAASYEARRFGIHSAMSLREAYRRCPEAVFLPVDGRRYQAASRDVMTILRRFTPLVEPISIDEAFLDVTGSAALFGDGPTIARRIKDETRDEVGLTASVGVASTKLVAKIASDLRKPDGLVVVPVGEEVAFLAPLPIGRLWGVGEKTAVALAEYSVRTIGDLAALPPDLLVRRFGKHGASLVDRARGIDPDPVHDGDPAKSVSHEHTFDVDTSDPEVIERALLAMADGVAGRLRSAGVRAGTVAVKIRDSSFKTITRQRTLAEPTDLTDPIYTDRARTGPAGDPRDARAPAGRRGIEPGRTRTARDVRYGRAAPSPRGGGRRLAPPPLRRTGGDAGTAARDRSPGAVRARSAEPAGPPGARRPDRVGRRRCRSIRAVTR